LGKITTRKSGNGGYKSAWIYIPSKVYKDELFPFQDSEEVIIEIEEGTLIISKNDENKTGTYSNSFGQEIIKMKYIFANYEENPMIRFIISELDKHTYLSVRALKISIEERFRISPLAKKRNISNIIRNVSRDLISLDVLEK